MHLRKFLRSKMDIPSTYQVCIDLLIIYWFFSFLTNINWTFKPLEYKSVCPSELWCPGSYFILCKCKYISCFIPLELKRILSFFSLSLGWSHVWRRTSERLLHINGYSIYLHLEKSKRSFFWQDRLDFKFVYPRVRCRKSQMFLFAHLCKECMKVLIILNHLHCQIFAVIRSLAGIYIYTPCDLY